MCIIGFVWNESFGTLARIGARCACRAMRPTVTAWHRCGCCAWAWRTRGASCTCCAPASLTLMSCAARHAAPPGSYLSGRTRFLPACIEQALPCMAPTSSSMHMLPANETRNIYCCLSLYSFYVESICRALQASNRNVLHTPVCSQCAGRWCTWGASCCRSARASRRCPRSWRTP